jgi:hypothetical protein
MSFRVRPSAVIVRIGLRWLAEEVADLKVRIALLPEIGEHAKARGVELDLE